MKQIVLRRIEKFTVKCAQKIPDEIEYCDPIGT